MSRQSSKPLVTLADVRDAEARIAPHVVTTPLIDAPLLDREIGFRLLVKAENLQLTGAFKVRGAFNHIMQLSEDERRRGVVAVSSGNHAQAVAYAAQSQGVPATIVMPRDAPRVKLERTRRYGATIVLYDRETDDRDAVADGLAARDGLRIVHPYDDPRTIAGQGTIGLEIFRQTRERSVEPHAIVAGCSGGGLASGLALTLGLYDRRPRLFTAEPENFDDMRRSLALGAHVVNEQRSGSICDALLAPTPGRNTLPILLECGAEGLAASDAEVESAVRVAAAHFNMILEPGGAAALACALARRGEFSGRTVVVVASGGNIDTAAYADLLARAG
ncbi:MAG: pyridoxal-5'-phosphate-dependent protein [Methylocystaceae bacterium]|nr:MAG: pyridoxal-5'-phosphate-dependent protein [Methylocystaceae bacterium]